MCLDRLLELAREHAPSSSPPRIDGDELVIPFDIVDGRGRLIATEIVRVRTRRQFLEAFGYQ